MLDPIFNPLDENTINNPHQVYSYLRENYPVYWHEKMQSWIITRYDDCRTVMSENDIWARDLRRAGIHIPDDLVSMQSMDPPSSLPVREIFNSALHSYDSNRIARFMDKTICALLSQLKEKDKFCFMHDFAFPASEEIICEMFGLNPPKNHEFHEISYGIALQMDSGLVPEQRFEGRKIADKLWQVVDQGYDLSKEGGLFALMIKEFENTDWPPTLMRNSMAAMFNAAYSTMYTSFGSFALTLAEHPSILNQINKDNLSSAANEFLRFTTPAQATTRVAVQETQLRNVIIKPFEKAITIFAAANRDPEIFENPDELNVNRLPNPHLSFAFGPHMCLGARLARLIAKRFLVNMIQMPQLHLRGDPKYFRTATLRWLETLPVSFKN